MSERILDLFGGAGGAGEGYARAGFGVVGVDLAAQPSYPFEFRQGDAIGFLRELADEPGVAHACYSAIHASPPCQVNSSLRHLHKHKASYDHANLLEETRELLEEIGLPFVIENVPGAPMRKDYVLCGSQFGLGATCRDGKWRQLRRHRWFEVGGWTPPALRLPCAHEGEPVGVYGHGGAQVKTVWSGGSNRGYMGTLAECREAMGIDWMNKREVSQAIPPAYTELIGGHLLEHLRVLAA